MAYFNGNNNNNLYNGGIADDIIYGNGGNDILSGGDGNDYIDGGNHDDILRGDAGNDTLLGGSGSDRLNGGAGNDSMNGGSGIDMADFSGGATVWVNLATGTATGQGTDTLTGIENVWGSSFADFITGNSGNNQLYGNDGNDVLTASLGVDLLDGGVGTGDSVSFAGSGAATANLTTGQYAFNATNYGTLVNIEHITGSSNGDNFVGSAVRNVIDSKAGNDTIAGGGGDDQLWGGAGSDRIIADGGNDTLSGNYSYVDGYGDNSADTFEIRTNAGNVTINDFKLGIDKLDLTSFGFDSNGVSANWTGSAVQSGPHTLLTLTSQSSQVVTVCLQGVVSGHLLSTSDMIGGSASLIAPPPTYPINGGDGFYTEFLINPLLGNQTIDHFENGLDKMDLSQVGGYGGFLYYATDGSNDAILHFEGANDSFDVRVTGVPYWQIDATDYVNA